MARRGHLHGALARGDFRRLLAVRLAGQFGDGVFTASLAGAVLFDPERQASAADVAAAFTVLLLPYSIVGPFAGVLLDRWSRRQVLVWANAARALAVLAVAAEIGAGVQGPAFYASGLVVISISRFLLSALGAALPNVVADADLVTANAFSSTAGAVSTAVGGGAAVALRGLLGTGHGDYAVIALVTVLPYLLGGLVATGFGRPDLGPTDSERRGRETPADVARGLVAGGRYVRSVPPVWNGLVAVGVHRLCYGVWTVCTLLLYRNYLSGEGFFRAGLAGLSQLVGAVAIGGAAAAFATPAAFREWGAVRWPAALLAAAAVIEPALGLSYEPALLVSSALLLGFCAQAIKISVDTLVQHHIVDEYRGRVFALYDTLFNLALVVAAALTAAVLPEDGHSPGTAVAIGLAWAATGAWYLSSSRRTTPSAR